MNEPTNKRFKDLEEEIFETEMKRNPTIATGLGIHKYDNQLPKINKKRYQEDIELLKNWKKELQNINPEELNKENQVNRDLGLYTIKKNLFHKQTIQQWKQNPSVADTIGNGLFLLIKRDFAPLKKRIKSIKERIKDIPTIIDQEKTKLEDPIELWIDMEIESTEQLPILLDLIQKLGKEELPQKENEELKKSIKTAKKALEEYKEYLETQKEDAKQEFAIGKQKFEELLKKRKLGYNSQEILELGENLLEKHKKRMKKYAEQINPEKETQEVIEQVKTKTPNNFQEALNRYKEGIQDAKKYVKNNEIATLPENEELKVTETPEFLRHVIPFAAYMPPAKYDPTKEGIYMVTPPENEEALNNHSYWDIRNTSIHEGYPGHHLQLAASTTNDDYFRIMTQATEMVEGWAHYCEEMMKEKGFDDTPESRLLQTKDLVWRAARIIVDVKLSRGEMSFDEAVEFMKEEVGMDEDDAVAEVKRYTQNPAYQLSYLLGKHMIKDLKQEIKEEMGEDFTEKIFHDTILYAGSIPIKDLKKEFQRKINT